MRIRTLVAPLVTVLFAAAIVACGPGATSSTPPASLAPSVAPPSDAPTSSTEASSPGSSVAAGGETVAIGDSDLGQILVDGEGRTLYGFTPDEASGEPTCYDACAAAWPPLLETDEVTVGAGLDDSDFSLVERTDGGMQVKIGTKYPLYYFASDAAPGDTKGQGLNDIWYVVAPDGTLIK